LDAITKECVPVSDETIKDSLVWNLVDVKVMRVQRAVVCIPFQVEKFYPCIEVLGVVGNSRGTNERWFKVILCNIILCNINTICCCINNISIIQSVNHQCQSVNLQIT
jgi:hypothetical protein